MKKSHVVFKVIGVLIILVCVIAVGVYVTRQNQEAETMPTVRGQVACLPLKNGESINEKDCEKGLKNKAGLYLAVQSVSQQELKLGETIDVEGNLQPLTDDGSPYMIAGTIVGRDKEQKK